MIEKARKNRCNGTRDSTLKKKYMKTFLGLISYFYKKEIIRIKESRKPISVIF